jgi:hypothetical protein
MGANQVYEPFGCALVLVYAPRSGTLATDMGGQGGAHPETVLYNRVYQSSGRTELIPRPHYLILDPFQQPPIFQLPNFFPLLSVLKQIASDVRQSWVNIVATQIDPKTSVCQLLNLRVRNSLLPTPFVPLAGIVFKVLPRDISLARLGWTGKDLDHNRNDLELTSHSLIVFGHCYSCPCILICLRISLRILLRGNESAGGISVSSFRSKNMVAGSAVKIVAAD